MSQASSVDASKRVWESPDATSNEKLRFRFDLIDNNNWPLHKIQSSHHQRLLKRLSYFEGLTLEDAKSNGSLGDYDMTKCRNKAAAKILKESHEGLDSLCKLVIQPSGPLRLFGIREANVIHILWWDSKHEIWPEGKTVK
ncbi:hypothetical protein [Arthrobacter sp. HY1533]|uniref:hypothetical protein n=1 Tax=Arthrobacter sp. HY1533 TaxID=2970919 RepID=UPI0022B9D5E7|nr:hypothetical protein [Arthrobacter sp. HY1533]